MPFDSSQTKIANGASLSAFIDLQDHELVAIVWPAAWTAAVLTLQSSLDGATYFDVVDAAGTEVSFPTQTSKHMLVDPTKPAYGLGRFIKLRSGTSAAPVNQAAERTIGVLLARA